MPYPNIDPEVREKYSSAWVVYPNSEYDPVLGQSLYSEYLDQLTFADQIGFDAVVVNEHHQNAYVVEVIILNILIPPMKKRT